MAVGTGLATSRLRAGACGLALLAALGAVAPVVGASGQSSSRTPAPSAPTPTDLGTLGGDISYALAVNNSGVVVGRSEFDPDSSVRHGFVWDPATAEMTDLIPSDGAWFVGSDVNEGGLVVGTGSLVDDDHAHALVWDLATDEVIDLGTLGGSYSTANAINAAGVVVGSSELPGDLVEHAFLWDPAIGEMVDLGTLGGRDSAATGINDAGFVAGTSDNASDDWRAFVWDPSLLEMRNLGTLGGSPGDDFSWAVDINEHGVVVGSSGVGGTTRHGFSWDPVTGEMTDIGTLGGEESFADAINDAGLVVGTSDPIGGRPAVGFAWDPATGDMAELGTLGGFRSEANDINDEGVVVGNAALPGDVVFHTTRWTPPFIDVQLSNPFAGDVAWLVDAGITTGYLDGTFRPARSVSRQAMAVFLYRLAGEPAGADPTCSDAPFPDVPATHAFCGEIAWAVEAGVATGFPDGTFRPDGRVSREAMVAFLYRIAGSPHGEDPSCTESPFTDIPVAHVFCGEISWAADEGVASGYVDATFRPARQVTRQAMAAFLHRYDQLP